MYQKHPRQQHASLNTADYDFSIRLGRRRHLTCSRSHDRRPEETVDRSTFIFLPAAPIDGRPPARRFLF